MKKLILIRHAKAEQPVLGEKDFDRILNPEGIHTALKIGIRLLEKHLNIEQVLSSTSCRTRMTTEYLVERINIDEDQIIYREELYLASLRIWLQEINQLEDDNK